MHSFLSTNCDLSQFRNPICISIPHIDTEIQQAENDSSNVIME